MVFFQQSGCLMHYTTIPYPPKLFIPSHSKSQHQRKKLQPLCENTQPPRIPPNHQIHTLSGISILLLLLLLLLSKSSSRLFPNSTQRSSRIFPNSSRIWQEFATCNARGPRRWTCGNGVDGLSYCVVAGCLGLRRRRRR